jgi:uncharacterized protein YndB with AHSA1/START domain
MKNSPTEIRSVIVEREVPYPAEKIWRALTEPHLLEEWLMKNNFTPDVGSRFEFSGDWGAVACEIKVVEPNKTLAYTWDAMGLESIVTWTLTPTANGTSLRMEQSGFRHDQEQAFQGAKFGWQKFIGQLENILTTLV